MKSIFIATGVLWGGLHSLPGEIPDLLERREFNCATLADAANYYIEIGEKRAIRELMLLEEDSSRSMERGFNRNERIGWICRIVFRGRNDAPLRPPRYGALHLPYGSMPLERWPLYPVAEAKGLYFVLSEGYLLAGVAERASAYIEYCRSTGTFRKSKLDIPTPDEAVAAFNSIKRSEPWRMIKWQDEGPGFSYTMHEDWILGSLQEQATKTPEK